MTELSECLGVLPGYSSSWRRLKRMQKALDEHPHPLDPDCPEWTQQDVDDYWRQLEKYE